MIRQLELDGGDCALILRDNGEVDLIVQVQSDVVKHHEYYLGEAALVAAGVMWALENDEWREALIKKSRAKVLKGLRSHV